MLLGSAYEMSLMHTFVQRHHIMYLGNRKTTSTHTWKRVLARRLSRGKMLINSFLRARSPKNLLAMTWYFLASVLRSEFVHEAKSSVKRNGWLRMNDWPRNYLYEYRHDTCMIRGLIGVGTAY